MESVLPCFHGSPSSVMETAYHIPGIITRLFSLLSSTEGALQPKWCQGRLWVDVGRCVSTILVSNHVLEVLKEFIEVKPYIRTQ